MNTTPMTSMNSDSAGAAAFATVDNLVFSYGERRVLDGVSFSVVQGETFGLLGPNGSGKSTVLSLMAGILPGGGPSIRLTAQGRPPGERSVRARTGVVFQNPGLDVKLTARENLELAARQFGYTAAECRRRAARQLDQAGLADRAADPVGTLSGGMRRRVDIARALIHDPDILFMDEPTAGLDEMSFRATWQRLDDLRRDRAVTIVVATHRPDEAERCDRLAIIHQGRVARIGTPDELRRLVASDVVTLRGPHLEDVADEIRSRFAVSCTLDPEDDELMIDADAGHELIPRLVEAFPPGRFRSIGLHQPSLADAFLKITGHALLADNGENP